MAACFALSGTLALAACGGGDGGGGVTPPPTPLVVTATGRLERSSTIALSVTKDGAAVPLSSVAITTSPANAVQLVGTDSAKLAVAGHITVTATLDGRTGTASIDVATPPTVVFDLLQGGNRDIWRVDLDGQNLAQLTTDPGDDQAPTAAKGTVVFVSYRSGNGDLYSIPLAGGTTTRLTTTAKDENTPALSADGSKLAYSYVPSDVSKIYTATATAANPAPLGPAAGSEVIETAPTWSPAGVVAYVSTANGTADIFQATPGGASTLLVGGPQAEVEPSWSPNGQSVAFVSNRSGATELFMIGVSSGTITQLTSGAPGNTSRSKPSWTPDGRIVYLETVGTTTHLYWMDPAAPSITHPIDTGTGTVGHPSVARP